MCFVDWQLVRKRDVKSINQPEVAALIIDDSIDGWMFKPFGLEQLKAMLLHIGLPSSAGAKPL